MYLVYTEARDVNRTFISPNYCIMRVKKEPLQRAKRPEVQLFPSDLGTEVQHSLTKNVIVYECIDGIVLLFYYT